MCSSALAKRIVDESFGLIFGINTFVALVMQSLLTVIVVSGNILKINIVNQFLVYAGFYFVFAFLYLINIIVNVFNK